MFTSSDSETDEDDSSDSNTYGKIFQYEPQKKVGTAICNVHGLHDNVIRYDIY